MMYLGYTAISFTYLHSSNRATLLFMGTTRMFIYIYIYILKCEILKDFQQYFIFRGMDSIAYSMNIHTTGSVTLIMSGTTGVTNNAHKQNQKSARGSKFHTSCCNIISVGCFCHQGQPFGPVSFLPSSCSKYCVSCYFENWKLLTLKHSAY